MIKVVKFGGSSLASAEQFKKVGAIIRADEDRRYVVPSAPGKRSAKDTKVTDMLYECYAVAEAGKEFTAKLAKIKDRYDSIIGSGSGAFIGERVRDDHEELQSQSRKRLCSFPRRILKRYCDGELSGI